MKNLLILLIGFNWVWCQENGIIQYSTKEGLTSNTCYLLSQDKNQKMWIGSDNGLNSFDGKEFSTYDEKNGFTNLEIIRSTSFGDNKVFIIDLTHQGFIFSNNKLIRLQGSMKFNAQCVELAGRIYLFNDHKLYELVENEGFRAKQFLHFHYDKIAMSNESKALYNVGDRIYLFDLKNLSTHLIQENKGNTFSDLDFTQIKNDRVFNFHQSKLQVFEIENNTLIPNSEYALPYPENEARYRIDRNSNVWIMPATGGLEFSYLNNSSKKSLDFFTIDSFSTIKVNDIFVDANHNIWVSSDNKGLFFIQNARTSQILNYPFTSFNEDVKNIEFYKGKVYFSIGADLYQIEGNNDIHKISNPIDEEEIRILKKIGNKLFVVRRHSIQYLDNQQLIKMDIPSHANKNIGSFQDGYLISNFKDLLFYNPTNHQSEVLFTQRNYNTLQFSKDSLWVGTPSGLYKLQVSTKQSKPFLASILGSYQITDIAKVKDQLYVCATNASGLFFFNNYQFLHQINTQNGLSNNNVKSLSVEGSYIYAVTFNGLNKIPIDSIGQKVYTFNVRDGLPSNNINDVIYRNDSLLIATDRGLFVSQAFPYHSTISAQVTIENIQINDSIYYQLNQLPKIYSNQSLKFKLVYPDYASLGDISFKYKLENYDKNWTLTRSNELIYKNLPPGNYILKVIGINSKKEESPRIFEYAIPIQYRWYQHTWVQVVLVLIGLILLLSLVYSIARRRSHNKINNEKKLAELELKAIKAQLNPHFISNCLNSISFLVHKGELDIAQKYINIFSRMIRLNLDYSNQSFVTIEKEMTYLEYYIEMEKLRFGDKFSYDVQINETDCKLKKIPTFFIQPIVENAIKHAFSDMENKGKIQVKFHCISDSETQITIMDNGKGIDTQKDLDKDQSYGVSLILNRIETFNKLYKTNISYSYGNGYQADMMGAYFQLNIKNYE